MKEIKDGIIKTAIFDMDGTIYQLDGDNDGFINSTLHKIIKRNTINYFSRKENISPEEAILLIQEINTKHSHMSLYVADHYHISRKDFFDQVWDIEPQGIVSNFRDSIEVLKELSKTGIELILVTQAPSIWQNKVFTLMGIQNVFKQVITAENFLNKTEVFPNIAKGLNPKTVIAIGDQLDSDIAPAQELGFYTFHVKSPNDLLKLLENE